MQVATLSSQVIVEEAAQVVAGLGQLVVRTRDFEPAVAVLLEHEHFALDAEIESEAELGRLIERVL